MKITSGDEKQVMVNSHGNHKEIKRDIEDEQRRRREVKGAENERIDLDARCREGSETDTVGNETHTHTFTHSHTCYKPVTRILNNYRRKLPNKSEITQHRRYIF